MGRLILHSEAEQELDQAVTYYEKAKSGLGREFRDEVLRSLAKIAENPMRYSVRKLDVRWANLDRFPYNVNYTVEGEDIVIVAIAGNRQKPFYWLRRLAN